MIFEAILIDTCCHQVIGEKVFEVVIAAPKNNPYGGVLAANRATSIILDQVTCFVIRTIESHPAIPLPRRTRFLIKPEEMREAKPPIIEREGKAVIPPIQ